MTSLDEHIIDAIKLSGSKQRFPGTVVGFDQIRTTIFIKSDDGRVFLAFLNPKHPLNSGDAVTFRIDGMRAKEIRKEIPADS
jgi:hypothetical protein